MGSHRQGLPIVRYLPPFDFLKSQATVDTVAGQTMIHMSHDELVEMLRSIIINMDIDEAWYLRRYPDVAEAVRAGTFKSAKEHFVNNGYFEGRMPFQIEVDERYYLASYPELVESIQKEVIANGQQHFDENGYLEGRRPFEIKVG